MRSNYGNIYFFIGLEGIYYLTRQNQKISFYLEAWDGEVRMANYSTFYIDDVSTNYVLHVRLVSDVT